MGAVNYGASDIINIGWNYNRFSHLDEEDRQAEYNFMYDKIQEFINDYSFYHYKINIEPGYYEGFYINISYEDYNYFDDYEEKQEAIKELSNIHRLLKSCIEWGLVAYSPGWCTGWSNEADSKKQLQQAIKTAKQTVKRTPTYKNYKGVA